MTRHVQFLLDLLILVAAFLISYQLRFDFAIPEDQLARAAIQLPYVVLIQFAALMLAGGYGFIWRYTGMAEIRSFITAGLWSCLLLVALRAVLPAGLRDWRVPLSIALVDSMLSFGGALGLRVMRRALYERHDRREKKVRFGNGKKKPILLIGAGRAGVLAAREISGRGDMDLEIKGFVDDDLKKQGMMVHRFKVLGTTADLPRLINELEIDHVVITIADVAGREIRRIVKICEQVPIRVRIIPGLYEILQGKVEVSRIRDLQIEDLLGRETVSLDEDGMRQFLADKIVMVTGAGGSIGAELARQVARFGPSKLLLVERAEFALFNIDRELRYGWPGVEMIPIVGDIGDESRMSAVLRAGRPNIILHAAAHKHVPMMESNATEAVKNNVLATRLLGRLAGESGVEVFVLISTDKAVRPTSIMGATKRVAELVVQELNQNFATRYVAVRFGNVIGSTGSVVTIFRDQIRRGGPVTVTHPDMYRYFMTIPEASQLVLQAGAMGKGGEIFVLDMGEPVRILDLARDTITLSGLKPGEDIEVVFTGVRPGEKLFEELEIGEEQMTRTRHPKIFIGMIAGYPKERVQYLLRQLAILLQSGHEPELRRFLSEMLPEAQIEKVGSSPEEAVVKDSVEGRVHQPVAEPFGLIPLLSEPTS